MAEDSTLPQVQACRLRVARLTSAGAPASGADNLYVTDTMVSIQFQPVYVDGQEIEQKNGADEIKVNYRSPDNFKRGNITIQLTSPDPELAELLSSGSVLTDGTRKGYAAPALGATPDDAVSIEAWVKRIKDGVLDVDSPYGWYAYPKVTNLRITDHTLQNGVLLPQFSGQCYENAAWGTGPTADWPVDSTRVFQWIPTSTMPAAVAGYQAIA